MQTSGFTVGDNVTHFCDKFQCSRMLRTVEHLFFLVCLSCIDCHRLCRDIIVVLIASCDLDT